MPDYALVLGKVWGTGLLRGGSQNKGSVEDASMNCPACHSQTVVKNGTTKRQDGSVVQKYQCKACKRQFNMRSGTPMPRLRTPSVIVGVALNMRADELGIRATGRSFDKSHSIIIRWEQRLA